MPIQFPANPALNQQHITGGKTWVWNGVNWAASQSAGAAANLLSVGTSVLPGANVAYDLGRADLRWRDLYLSGNTLDIGGTAIKSTANGVSFTSAANAQARVPITVGSIQLGTGANAVTLSVGASGLETIGSTGNAIPISGGGASITTSNTAPASPSSGALWYDTDTGDTYVFYANTWAEVGAGSVPGATGATGATGAGANLSAVNTSIVPTANSAYDLGTSSLRWRDLYLSGNTLDLGGTKISSNVSGVSFKDSSNNAVSISVSTITVGSGANAVVLQGSQTGLKQTVGNITTAAGGASVTVSNIAPTSPQPGNMWFDTESGRLLIYYNDGASSFWIVPLGGVGSTGSSGGIIITTVSYPGGANSALAAGGQLISVNGSNFIANCKVYVDKTECNTSNVTSSSLNFVSPAQSAGSYHLFVYNPDGTNGIKPIGIKYSA